MKRNANSAPASVPMAARTDVSSGAPQSAAERLPLGEHRYQTMLATIQDAYYECNLRGTLIYVNDAYVRVFGYASREEALGGSYRDFADGQEARDIIFAAFSEVYRTGQPCAGFDYSIIDQAGRRRWVATSITLLRDDAGTPTGFCGICRDITGRIEDRLALQQSEERFKTIFNTALDGIVTFDDELNYLDANPAALKTFNMTKAELLRHRLSDFVAPDRRAGFEQFRATLQREGAASGKFTREMNGKTITVEYNVTANFLPGQHLAMMRDVTARQQAEDELQASEERFAKAFRNNPQPMVLNRLATGRIVDVNESCAAVVGYAREELLGRTGAELGIYDRLEDRRAVVAAISAHRQIRNVEIPFRRRDGSLRHALCSAEVIEFKGEPHILAAAIDITDRKRAEAELRKSEERYRLLFERNLAGVYRSTFGGQLLQANRALARILGYDSVAEMQAVDTWAIYVNRDDRARMLELISQWGRLNNYELLLQRRDGTQIWTLSNITMTRDEDGVDLLEGVMLDISEQKRAEALLRESRERYRMLFEHSFAGIYRTTLDGRLLDCNDALARIFGFDSREELMKVNTAELYFDPKDHRDTIALALRDRRYANVERVRRRRDGQPVWTLSSGTVFETQEHGLVLEGVILDITDRKRTEEALSRSREQLRALSARLENIREEERKRIAREIHDELGQLMTGLKLDFAWIEKRVAQTTDEPLRAKLAPKLSEVAELLETTIRSVRDIAAQLRPGALDELGLPSAIEWQTGEISKHAEIEWDLQLCAEPEELESERATGLFRIFQEITTNILRHAAATRVLVELRRAGNELTLEVTDNGVGISQEQLRNTKSLGLAGIRERVLLLNGSLEISRQAKAGTRVTITIPIVVEPVAAN